MRASERSRAKYPLATISAYGPDNRRATKLVVGIVRRAGQKDANPIRSWTTDASDVLAQKGHAPRRRDYGLMVTVNDRTGSLAGAFTYAASNPPVISSISARGTRPNEPANFADVGEEMTVTAIAKDSDTPLDQLTYEWTADTGRFSGTGAEVKWRAPATATTARLTLAVSDGTTVTEPSQ